MDLLDRFLGHDLWTSKQLLVICSDLPDELLDQEFDIGHRSLRATFIHVVRNIEVWTDLMNGEDPRESSRSCGVSILDLLQRLESVYPDLVQLARSVADRNAWDERWVDILEDPPREKTFGAATVHLITHSMHHRAQILYLMRRVGLTELPEGDVFSWESNL